MKKSEPGNAGMLARPRNFVVSVARGVFRHLPLSKATKERLKKAVVLKIAAYDSQSRVRDARSAALGNSSGDVKAASNASSGPIMDFVCNICAQKIHNCPVDQIDREVASCPNCGSSVRMRSIVHLLSTALHGRSIALPDWPVNKAIKGVGLSDWHGYAVRLPDKVDYINTYFHTEPYLDICNPPDKYTGAFDFVISTEVFEHVPPPVSRAFAATYKILKPGGAFVFTVPFTNEPETVEHYPNLDRYEIVKFDKEYVVVNRRADGKFELHTNPVFHGGPGTTLEMRVFCRKDIISQLEAAGFAGITVMGEPNLEMGIIHKHPWSLPILARKPA